jgi:superfamily II DNA or RNA helicase
MQMVISNQIELPLHELPDHIRSQIHEHLTLRNPKYDAAVRQERSTYNITEYIKLFREDDGQMILPRGCGKWLQEIFIEGQVPFKAVDKRLTLPSVQFRSRIKPRSYQEAAIQALVSAKQGGVVAPCGAGKTMILLESMVRIGQPTLWVTHTRELAEQVIARATEVLDLTENEIGRLYGGRQTIGERFTVCLVQTLSKLDIDALKGKFGAILVDEAHHLAASTFFYPVGQFPAKYRLWASATPERSDGLTEMVFAGAGPILHAIDQGEVPTVTPRLEVIETDFSVIGDDYVKLIGDLVQNERRNQLIVNTIVEHAPGHWNLVLSDRVEHLHILRELLHSALPDMRIEVLVGSMKPRERNSVMGRVNAKQVDILLATQLAREGLDIQHLDHLYLATPKRAAGAVQQEVGRIMRPHPSKTTAVVFDFWDSQSPVLKQQFWKRREVYKAIGMDVSFSTRRRTAQ